MKPRTVALRWGLLMTLVPLLGCWPYTELSDESEALGRCKPHPGPYAVCGIRYGMTTTDCVRILGEPDEKQVTKDHIFWRWHGRHQVDATLPNPPGDVVSDISGDTLTDVDGRPLVGMGTSESEFKVIIPSARGEKNYSTGSAVIAVYSHKSTNYDFRDDRARYEISFDKDGRRIMNLWARPPNSR